eukprot:TRINITY_DN13595_c0_g1_i1.p1 TRINITY_DN13595_c0_g1~~TRINITY_DN13595_c0_g1_i1.p1  ORF type:complete len:177 (+),score=21.26 TRINITY_DN13595_c0_g1_i1:69-599(+)
MIRRPPRSTLSSSSAASDVYKRQVQVWCQWRGCHKVPMYAQSLHRHVKESHIGFGNRYNTGQGGVPIQTEAGGLQANPDNHHNPLPSHPPASVPMAHVLPSLSGNPGLSHVGMAPTLGDHPDDTDQPLLDEPNVHWTHTILPGPQHPPFWQCYPPQVDVETLATSLNLSRPIFDGF